MSIKLLKKQGGFTLLELLIVIVIIGILALLIIPNITSAPKKARDTQRKTDITAVRKALEEYYVSNSVYPGGSGALRTGTVLQELTGGSAPIMKELPKDPKGDGVTSPYVYTYVSANSNTEYTISACLENNQDNGQGIIAADASNNTSCPGKVYQLKNNN